MRYLIAGLVIGLTLSTAQAESGRDKTFLLCADVRVASRVHQMVTADKNLFRPVVNNVLDDGSCDLYQGAHRWSLIDTNRTIGYGKITYDTDTKKPKIGYTPYFEIFGMGLGQ